MLFRSKFNVHLDGAVAKIIVEAECETSNYDNYDDDVKMGLTKRLLVWKN